MNGIKFLLLTVSQTGLPPIKIAIVRPNHAQHIDRKRYTRPGFQLQEFCLLLSVYLAALLDLPQEEYVLRVLEEHERDGKPEQEQEEVDFQYKRFVPH